jgi:chromosome segregation ATPase
MGEEAESKSSPFADWSRERLEEQTLKSLKHIKQLRRQYAELHETAESLQQQLDSQISLTEDLQDENEHLKSSSNAFGIGALGKTLGSIIGIRSQDLTLSVNREPITIAPTATDDDSPQAVLLKNTLQATESQAQEARHNESVIREFASSLQTKYESREVAMNALQQRYDEARSESDQLRSDLTDSKESIASLNDRIQTLESELAAARSTASHLVTLEHKAQTFEKIQKENAELNARIAALKQETMQLQIAQQETERQNCQLKDSLERFIESDKAKETEIDGLTRSVSDLADQNYSLEAQFTGIKGLVSLKESEIARLTKSLSVLEERLDKGKGSAAHEAKSAQVSKMLERSNALYAEAAERAANFENRVKHLEVQLHAAVTPGKPALQIRTAHKTFVLCENGRFFEGKSEGVLEVVCVEKEGVEKGVQVDSEGAEYLKGLVVQFFRASGKARLAVLPVVLGFLGLDAREVEEITIREKGGGVFGMFG